jgi:hypothetical protein
MIKLLLLMILSSAIFAQDIDYSSSCGSIVRDIKIGDIKILDTIRITMPNDTSGKSPGVIWFRVLDNGFAKFALTENYIDHGYLGGIVYRDSNNKVIAVSFEGKNGPTFIDGKMDRISIVEFAIIINEALEFKSKPK